MGLGLETFAVRFMASLDKPDAVLGELSEGIEHGINGVHSLSLSLFYLFRVWFWEWNRWCWNLWRSFSFYFGLFKNAPKKMRRKKNLKYTFNGPMRRWHAGLFNLTWNSFLFFSLWAFLHALGWALLIILFFYL